MRNVWRCGVWIVSTQYRWGREYCGRIPQLLQPSPYCRQLPVIGITKPPGIEGDIHNFLKMKI
jgi:hypothetical protein